MIPKEIVDWLSPLLGLIGSLMLAIPYFADFWTRFRRKRKIEQVDVGVFDAEDAAQLREGVRKVRTEQVLEPDAHMAFIAGAGCILLVLSFLVLLLAAPGKGFS